MSLYQKAKDLLFVRRSADNKSFEECPLIVQPNTVIGLDINNNIVGVPIASLNGSGNSSTSSLATTASYAEKAVTASLANTASYVKNAQTASYLNPNNSYYVGSLDAYSLSALGISANVINAGIAFSSPNIYDNSNENNGVGIGTQTPSYKLDVDGTVGLGNMLSNYYVETPYNSVFTTVHFPIVPGSINGYVNDGVGSWVFWDDENGNLIYYDYVSNYNFGTVNYTTGEINSGYYIESISYNYLAKPVVIDTNATNLLEVNGNIGNSLNDLYIAAGTVSDPKVLYLNIDGGGVTIGNPTNPTNIGYWTVDGDGILNSAGLLRCANGNFNGTSIPSVISAKAYEYDFSPDAILNLQNYNDSIALIVQPQDNSSSFVGINNSSPSYTLDVSGSIRTTGFITPLSSSVVPLQTGSMFYSASKLFIYTGTGNAGGMYGWQTASLGG